MKLRKTILTILIMFAAVQFCSAQETPKAVLVESFGKTNCDPLGGHLDSWLVGIRDSPGSTGYAVIYTGENTRGLSFDYLSLIGARADFRKFDTKLISIIRAKKDTDIEVQLWKIPPGADKPKIEEPEWSNVLPPSTKPFVFTSDSIYGLCYGFSPKYYAEFLEANPNARGHLVIYEQNQKAQREEADRLIKSLAAYGILRSRLRIFYVRTRERYEGHIEFWFVPARK